MDIKPKFKVGDKVTVKEGFSNLFSNDEQLINEYKKAENKEHIIKDVLLADMRFIETPSKYFLYVLGTGRILFREEWLSENFK